MPIPEENGEEIWVHSRAITIYCKEGRRLIDGIHSDVTAYKQVEERLRKLSLAVEQSPASVVITDMQGNIEYVNPKFTQVTGYTAEEAIGQNPRVLNSGCSLQASTGNFGQRFWLAVNGEGNLPIRKRTRYLLGSGSIVPIRTPGGAITHFLAVKETLPSAKGPKTRCGLGKRYRRCLSATWRESIARRLTGGSWSATKPPRTCSATTRLRLFCASGSPLLPPLPIASFLTN